MAAINFSGLASGIDSNALIEATSAATRKQRVEPNEKKVADLEETNSTYKDLKAKLEELKKLSLKFATLSGGALSKTALSTNEAITTASAANSAANGSYVVSTTQRAKNHTHSFDDRFASTDTFLVPDINNSDPDADRTVTYTIGTGANEVEISVQLTSMTRVSDFVNSFNNHPNNNGRATATMVNVGTASSPSYAIMINTNFEGEDKGLISSVSVGASVQGESLFTSGFSENAAVNAVFSVSGIAGNIVRSSNTVSDVIPGLTLSLQDTGTTTITVGDDISATTAKVQEFVDKYNEIVAFIAENNIIRREENGENVENIFGPLSNTRTDDNVLIAIRNAISGSTFAGGLTIKIFSDFGITTARDGTLSFDTDKFKTSMNNEPNSINEVLKRFADKVAITGGTIDQFIRFNGLIDVTINGNTSLISNLNDRIAQAETQILRQEELLKQRYARLESLMGRLQGQQQALSSALAGLSGNNNR